MLNVTVSGLNAARKGIDVASNNISNGATVGFKQSTASFSDVFPNDPSANPKTSVGAGVTVTSVDKNMSQGSISSSGKVTDLAITGNGFFVLGTAVNNSSSNNDNNIPITQASINLHNIDDTYKIYIDGNLVKEDIGIPGSHSASDLNLDITSYIKNTGSDISIEISNVSGPWSYSYEISLNNKIVSSDQNPGNGWADTKTGLIKTVNLTTPPWSIDIKNTQSSSDVFTRAGDFQLDKEGYFVNSTGLKLQGYDLRSTDKSKTSIRIPFDNGTNDGKLQNIMIDSKGIVSVNYAGETTPTELFQITIATFPKDSSLKAIGNTNFMPTGESGNASYGKPNDPGFGSILSGSLEESNVDMTNELVRLIKYQQIYNGNARILQTMTEVASRVTDKL